MTTTPPAPRPASLIIEECLEAPYPDYALVERTIDRALDILRAQFRAAMARDPPGSSGSTPSSSFVTPANETANSGYLQNSLGSTDRQSFGKRRE